MLCLKQNNFVRMFLYPYFLVYQNLNYKIRDHSLAKIPLLLICGKKEVDSNSVTIRRLNSDKQENMDIETFLQNYSALNKASSN